MNEPHDQERKVIQAVVRGISFVPDADFAVRLVGDERDIRAVGERLHNSANKIGHIGPEFFLTTPAVPSTLSVDERIEHGDMLVELLNAIGKLAYDGFQPLDCDGITWKDDAGEPHGTAYSRGSFDLHPVR